MTDKRDSKLFSTGKYTAKLKGYQESFGGKSRLKFTVYNDSRKIWENVLTNDSWKTDICIAYVEKRGGFNFEVELDQIYQPKFGRTYNTIIDCEFTPEATLEGWVKDKSEEWQGKEGNEQANAEYQADKGANWASESLKKEIRSHHRDELKNNPEFAARIKRECEQRGLSFERREFELDHIIPLCSYDLSDPDVYNSVLRNVSNIQALSPEDNNRKWAN